MLPIEAWIELGHPRGQVGRGDHWQTESSGAVMWCVTCQGPHVPRHDLYIYPSLVFPCLWPHHPILQLLDSLQAYAIMSLSENPQDTQREPGGSSIPRSSNSPNGGGSAAAGMSCEVLKAIFDATRDE